MTGQLKPLRFLRFLLWSYSFELMALAYAINYGPHKQRTRSTQEANLMDNMEIIRSICFVRISPLVTLSMNASHFSFFEVQKFEDRPDQHSTAKAR